LQNLSAALKDAGFLEAEVVAYTDGACHPNPGPGGWAAILLWRDQRKAISGGEFKTTNNRMEIQAVLETLLACKRPVSIIIYSDSKYVVQSIGQWAGGSPTFIGAGWIAKWRANSWRKADNEDVINRDLWKKIWDACVRHRSVELRHVRGHSGNPLNEEADQLAVAEKLKIRERIKDGKRSGKSGNAPNERGAAQADTRSCPRL